MPATQEDYDKVKALQEQAKTARASYGSLTSAAETFADRVMQGVRAARADRGMSQLATDIGQTSEYLVARPDEIRARMQGVNPFDVIAATSKERALNLGQLAREAQFGQETQGTIGEAIEGGASTVRAMAQRALVEAEQKKQEASDLLAMLEFQEAQEKRAFDEWATKEGLRLEEARINKPTGDQQRSSLLTQLKSAVMGGATLQNVMQEYSTELPTDVILQIYNINSPYGPAQESPRELEKFFGIKPSKTSLEEQEVQNVIVGLEDIKSKVGQATGYGDIVALNTQKKNVGQWLARLVETGRLSDQDRAFYQKQLPSMIELYFTPVVAKQKLDQVINDLQVKITGSSTGGGEWE